MLTTCWLLPFAKAFDEVAPGPWFIRVVGRPLVTLPASWLLPFAPAFEDHRSDTPAADAVAAIAADVFAAAASPQFVAIVAATGGASPEPAAPIN